MVTSPADDGGSGVRRRLLAGVVATVGARGYREVAVADVLAASGCARRSFYTHFNDLEAALHEAHRRATDELCELVTDAWARGSTAGLEAGLAAVLRRLTAYARDEPTNARFWLLEAPAAGGPEIWRQRERLAERLTAFARAALAERDGGAAHPAALAELFAAGVLATLRDRLAAGDPLALERVADEGLRLLDRLAPERAHVPAAA